MADVLVDTDVFIDHLRGARRLDLGDHRLHVSVITRAELVAGTSATGVIERLLDPFRELDVTPEIATRAGRVRRESGVRLPDALIGATALLHDLRIATRNVKDFDRIRGVRTHRW